MFEKTSGEIPPACLFITFSARYVCLFLWWQAGDRADSTQFVCPTSWTPPASEQFELEFSCQFAWNSTEISEILKLFIFYELLLLPPVGIEILISGYKFSIIRLKSQTREKLNLNFRFYRHAWDIWYLGDLRNPPTDLKVVFYLEKTNILSGDFCENLIHFFHSISFTSKGPRQDWEGQN